MEYAIGALMGLAVGSAIAWAILAGRMRDRLASEQAARVAAETRTSETEKRMEEQKLLLGEAKTQLSEAFKAIAGDTLRDSSTEFLKLAKTTLETTLTEAKGDLGRREEAIKGLVNPLSENLRKYEERVAAIEKSRQQAYGNLEQYLKTLNQSSAQLQKETANLVTALRKPQVRGRWGEMTLKRVVELAGLVDHCDFDEQVTVSSEEGRRRPDLIVHLPAGREIVVDTKVPLEAYLDATDASSEDVRTASLTRHAKHVRAHMNALSGKEYWSQFPQAPEFVVMFIPGESFFAAAADIDPNLVEDGLKKGVVPATPTTLIALLRAVAYGWRQEQLAKNAQEVSDLGRQLYERIRTMVGHIDAVGKGLTRTTTAYNDAVGSLESRVLPSARRFQDLGVVLGGSEIGELRPIDTVPRAPSVPELLERPTEPDD